MSSTSAEVVDDQVSGFIVPALSDSGSHAPEEGESHFVPRGGERPRSPETSNRGQPRLRRMRPRPPTSAGRSSSGFTAQHFIVPSLLVVAASVVYLAVVFKAKATALADTGNMLVKTGKKLLKLAKKEEESSSRGA